MFRWTRLATLAAVAAVLAMATGVAGATSKPGSAAAAGSQMPSAGKITTAAAHRAALLNAANLRTRAGAARYLRAIGVNPHHFVIQRGIRNYAGAKCPGAGWSCTSTAHPVIQIASAGGFNTFQCTTASCAVVQVSAPTAKPNPNPGTAVCIKTTGLTQSCSINQTSATANNVAIVVEGQVAGAKMSGLTQTASYSAQITQTATGDSTIHNGNTACVLQSINIDGSTQAKRGTPVLVTLNGQQSASISQNSLYGNNVVKNATPAGACDADGTQLTQSQTLSSSASGTGRVEQDQNANATAPNVQLDIKQNKNQTTPADSAGENHVKFSQTSNLSAVAGTTASGSVIQKQGTDAGGIQATVNQFANGVSTSDAVQTEVQCEQAQIGPVPPSSSCTTGPSPSYDLTQEQHGPLRKGPCPPSCSTQAGNSGDTFVVTQTSTQDNNTGDGQTNTLVGDYTTSGTCATLADCHVTQTTDVNGESSTNTQTGSSVNTQTTCSGSDCTSSGGQTGVVSVSPTGISASNTDVGEFGYGGMRGGGTGSITVSGIAAPVLGAFLYWNGPTNSSDPAANAAVTFNGTAVTGTNIGFASSNCWNAFANSQSYRADVTPLVSDDGTYSLSNFVKPDADINGVSLIVFYNDANSLNDRNVVLWNGNDSNVVSTFDPADWDETISGVQYPGSGAASLDLVVSDGQTFADGALVLNGTELVPAGNIFQGDSTPAGPFNSNGDLWDVKSFNIPSSFLQTGSNTLNLTSPASADCLSLVVAAANTPAAAPVIPR
jgi:hypothetical protein